MRHPFHLARSGFVSMLDNHGVPSPLVMAGTGNGRSGFRTVRLDGVFEAAQDPT